MTSEKVERGTETVFTSVTTPLVIASTSTTTPLIIGGTTTTSDLTLKTTTANAASGADMTLATGNNGALSALVINYDATTTLGNTTGSAATTVQAGTGAMTFTAGGIWDANVTGAATLDAASFSLDATGGASNVSTTGQDLTVSTITSGTLAVTSAATLDMDGVAVALDASGGFSIDGAGAGCNVSSTGQNLTVSTLSSGTLAVTSAGTLDVDGVAVAIDASNGLSLDGAGAASNLSSTGQNLTVSTISSGTLFVTGAALVDVDAGANLDIDVTGTAALDATGAITINGTTTTIEGVEYPSLYTALNDPTGFPSAGSGGTLSWDDGTYTFTITGAHDIYIDGIKTSKTTATKTITDSTGLHYIYYSASGVLSSDTNWPGYDVPLIATVYWNTTTNKGLLCDERHGISMDVATHQWAHTTIGTRYVSGAAGTFGDSSISIDPGSIADEDLVISWTPAKSTCNVLYKNGDANWEWDAAASVPYKMNGSNIRYNNGNALADAGANEYVAYWVFATNDTTLPIYVVMGQRTDTTIAAARAGNTYESLTLGTLPSKEMKLLYRVIYRNTGAPPTYTEAQDLRSISNVPAGTYVATDHGVLAGLTDDDHTIYPLLAGRSGGQTLVGGTGTTDDLTLRATAGVGASGSDIIFQVGNAGGTEAARFLYDGKFGVGTNAPSCYVDVQCTGTAKAITDVLELTNTANAADMDGTGAGLLFNLYYYDASTPAVWDAGRIVVAAEQDATSTASTQDAYMAFYTSVDGTNAERVRITSGGLLGVNCTPTYRVDALSAGAIAVRGTRTSSGTNTSATAAAVQQTTDQDMVDGFGARMVFYIRDTAAVDNAIGYVGAQRAGADNSGSVYLHPMTAGSVVDGIFVTPAQCLGLATNTFGTSAAKVFAISSGTAPSTSPADAVQLWSADRAAAAGTAGLNIRTENGNSYILADACGFGTITPSTFAEYSHSGTAAATYDMIALTNTVNAASMTATGTAILWNQWYYDAVTPAVADAGRLAVITEGNWTSDGATHDSTMSFQTALNGTITERLTINSAGLVRPTACAGAAQDRALLIGVGTSADPATWSTADKSAVEYRCKTTATSGTAYGEYIGMEAATAAEHIAQRGRCYLTASSGNAHGGHFTLEDDATSGKVTGLGTGLRANWVLGDAAQEAGGTYYGALVEAYANGSNSTPAAVTRYAILGVGANGDATGAAAIKNAIDFHSTGADSSGNMIYSHSHAPGDAAGSIRILVNGTAKYIKFYAAE